MGHGKNKQKNQKVGLGQQPKETREERRRRIEEEAKAREVCLPRLIVKKDDNNVLGFRSSMGFYIENSHSLTFVFSFLSHTHNVLAEN